MPTLPPTLRALLGVLAFLMAAGPTRGAATLPLPIEDRVTHGYATNNGIQP